MPTINTEPSVGRVAIQGVAMGTTPPALATVTTVDDNTAAIDVQIHGTVTVDTTGLATEDKQDDGNASLASIDAKTPALDGDGGAKVHVQNFLVQKGLL